MSIRPLTAMSKVLVVLLPLLLQANPARGQCAATSLFEPAVQIDTGAQLLKVADFNEDGILDLAIGAAAVADFDEDGVLDVVTQGYLSVRLGDGVSGEGNGSFGPRVEYFLAGAPGDSVTVLYGQGVDGHGTGAFANGRRYFAPGFMAGTQDGNVEPADYNEDGIIDLAVASPSCCADTVAFSLLLGQGSGGVGNGTFAPPVTYKNAQSYQSGISALRAADFNSDGILDIAALEFGSAVWVFSGMGAGGVGDGTFAPSLGYYTGFYQNSGSALAVDDVAEDGFPDLLVAGVSSSPLGGDVTRLALLRGRPGGGFTESFAITIGQTYCGSSLAIAVAEFNHDGISDVAVTTCGSSTTQAAVMLGHGQDGVGSGTFDQPATYPLPLNFGFGRVMVTADLNEDGSTDLLAGSTNTLTRMLGRCPSRTAAAPTLAGVRDVPEDQGGFVTVRWAASALDRPAVRLITGYTVWRRVAGIVSDLDARLRSKVVCVRPAHPGSTTTYWEALATLPAHYLNGYAFTARTTRDSLPNSNLYSAFFVSAVTDDPFLFFESEVDSGYSVDNLSPALPQAVRGYLIPESGDLVLHWRPNSEPDLHHYNVYRGTSPGFDATPTTLIASIPDTLYVDADFGISTFYRVSAVDIHGNESRPPVPVSVGAVEQFVARLYRPIVPAGGGPVQIRYAFGPQAMNVRLEIFDVAGRQLRLLEAGLRPPGEYSHSWDRRNRLGHQVAQGVYMIHLSAGSRRLSEKVVLLER